jgi:hypothetical protein
MQYDLSRVPTQDLKALRNKDYGAVSTPTLQYLKTACPKNVQGTAAGNTPAVNMAPGADMLPRSVPQAWSMAWGAKNPSGQGQPGYKTPPPEEWGRQNEKTRRVSAGIRNNVENYVDAVRHPVQTVGGMLTGPLIYGMAPFAALDKEAQIKTDPYSPFLPRFSKGPGHAPEVPPEYLDPERGRRTMQALDETWEKEKKFVTANVKDPLGIPGRALGYAMDHPIDTALTVAGGIGLAGKLIKMGKMGAAGRAAERVGKKLTDTSPTAPETRFPLRLPDTWYQKTIQGFIDQIGRLKHSKPTRKEIFSRFKNELVPVGEIDADTMARMGVKDPKVYTGEAYFLDHHVNHHPENIPARYRTIPDMLAHWDDIKIDQRPGRGAGYVFIKRYDKYHTLVTRVGEEEGRLLLHKTFFVKSSEPYPKLPSIKDRSVGEAGHTSIGSAPQRGAPPGAVTEISGLPTGRGTSVPKIGQEAKSKLSAIKDNAALRWLTDHDLQREYVRRAGGNLDKARDLAREDGWLLW